MFIINEWGIVVCGKLKMFIFIDFNFTTPILRDFLMAKC